MAYTPTPWSNNTTPPINAANLNKIENGVATAHDLADAAQGGVNALGLRLMTGTGSPQGAVAANPGTKYVDTVGEAGAWEWIKTSGTGTTGWEVTVGDTKWRLVTDYDSSGNLISGQPLGAGWEKVPAGPHCRVEVRRVGPRVTAVVRYVRAAVDDPSARIHTAAAGFAPENGTVPTVGFSAGQLIPLYARLDRPGSFSMPTGTNINFYEVNYATADPWPTVLPGVGI